MCETCNIKNDIERLSLKLRTLSQVWDDAIKGNKVGDQCGFDMNYPGPGLLKKIIEYLVGGTDDEEEDNQVKTAALHALAGMRGNLRLLTWIFDRLDPAIKHNTKLLYKARDLMQRVASFLYPRKHQYYGKQTNQYTQSQLAYLW